MQTCHTAQAGRDHSDPICSYCRVASQDSSYLVVLGDQVPTPPTLPPPVGSAIMSAFTAKCRHMLYVAQANNWISYRSTSRDTTGDQVAAAVSSVSPELPCIPYII